MISHLRFVGFDNIVEQLQSLARSPGGRAPRWRRPDRRSRIGRRRGRAALGWHSYRGARRRHRPAEGALLGRYVVAGPASSARIHPFVK